MKVAKYYNGKLAAVIQLTSAIRTQEGRFGELPAEYVERLRNLRQGETLSYGTLMYKGL